MTVAIELAAAPVCNESLTPGSVHASLAGYDVNLWQHDTCLKPSK